ncbi:PAS domain S-box protein [Halosimplex sp. TS25]|uniref:PAS domain S-box protein n=1 Tax=Halosimplex rarum TaxID=3396619 RepID=UPI0039ED61F3
MSPSSRSDAELQRRVRQQEAVADLGQRALEADELDGVMRDAVTEVTETLDTEYCEVFELGPDGERFELREAVGWSDATLRSTTVPAESDSQVGYTFRSGEPVVADDLAADERFDGEGRLVESGVVGGITVLVGPAADPWGVLGTHATERRGFTDDDATFVKNVANVVASAVERAETRNRLDEVYGRISDGFFALDEEWQFTYVNEHADDLINPDGRDLVGENVWDAFPEAVSRAFKPKYERAMYEQETVTFEEYYPDPLDAWFEIRAYPSESGLSVYFREVTERRERERELRRYEAIFEAANDGLYVVDGAGRFTMVNEAYAEMLGYDREDLIGEHVSLVVDEAVRERARDEEAALRAGTGEAAAIEAEMKAADGGRIPAEATFAMLPTGEDGQRRVGVVRDVSDRKERERELRRYERLVENLPVGVYRNTPGPDGEFVEMNEALARIFDADSPAELMEVSVSDLYPDPEAREAFSERLEREGVVRNEELKQETLDGRTIWVSVTGIRTEEDGDVYFDGIVQDVSDRKDRERELRETERRFEAVFEDPNILVGLLEPDGTVLDINETAMEYIDADLADVQGQPFWETPWWGEGDDVGDEVREWTERAAAGEYVDFQADLTRPDGERYTLEGFFRPVTDDDGEVVSIIVSDRDVSERREYERRLAESEQRYRALAEYFPNGIVTLFDHDLQYTLAAGQSFEDIPVDPGDLEGEQFSDAWPDDTADALEPVFEAALDGREQAVEVEYAGRDWIVHGVPITDERGDVFAGMTMAQDITERKERERALEESNERLEQFAYAASHDLQEPLRMVSSYLQLIERRYEDELDADGREFIEYAVDGADRMRNMIDGLLAYSRVETRGDPFETVDLGDVLADVREDLRMKIDETDAEITAESLPRVRGDPGQLRQVVQNLLDNAIEYSGDEPPRVHVAAERDGDRWTISVSDEGIGIDPGDADRAFEVFQRLHDRADYDGTGIGLALAERVVERHEGEIWVESEPDEGATFSFTLAAPEDDNE